MANAKISALTALTGSSVDTAADLLAIVDTSATTTKKILIDELRNAIGPVSGTKTATTSGTSVDYTSIATWVKKITIMLNGVSTNGTSPLLIQLGDSGGIEASGYSGALSTSISGATATASLSTGFTLSANVTAASTLYGTMVLTLEDSSTNTWTAVSIIGHGDEARADYCAGAKATSAALDRIRLTTVNGSDTFDAGSINVLYE